MHDTKPVPPDPSPGTPGMEYTYPLSDYARAAAESLGKGWDAESSFLGAWGLIFTTDARVSLRLYVDGDGSVGDLMVENRKTGEEHLVPAFHLPEGAPNTPEEMSEWGNVLALFVLSLRL